MSQWSYIEKADGKETVIGPISNDELSELIKAGQVIRTTQVNNPKLTSGRWVQAESVPPPSEDCWQKCRLRLRRYQPN